MKNFIIYLKDLATNKNDVGNDSYIEVFLNEPNPEINIEPRPAMVVVPGGAYEFVSYREGEPIVFSFMAEGFNCFLLKYTTHVKYPIPQNELALALKYINEHSEELNIRKYHVSIVGFSAGGHLTASYSLLYKELGNNLGIKDDKLLRPHSIVLSYSVNTTLIDTYSKTKDVITGGDENLMKKLDVPSQLDSSYPPTYIWTTKNDTCVPQEHTLIMIEALKKNHVKYESIIFENADHGGSLFNHAVYNHDYPFDNVKENRLWVIYASDFIFKLD